MKPISLLLLLFYLLCLTGPATATTSDNNLASPGIPLGEEHKQSPACMNADLKRALPLANFSVREYNRRKRDKVELTRVVSSSTEYDSGYGYGRVFPTTHRLILLVADQRGPFEYYEAVVLDNPCDPFYGMYLESFKPYHKKF